MLQYDMAFVRALASIAHLNAQTGKGFWFAAGTFLESFLINYGILFYIWSWKQIKAEFKCEMLKEPALNFLWK